AQAYGFVTLADEYCRVSALMPQKKNPYALAVIRHAGGAAAGSLSGLLSGLRTPTARTDHFLTAAGDVDRALRAVTGAVRLLAGVLATLTVDQVALARSAADPGLVLADLADRIVGEGLGDRRTVHQLLGRAARRAAGGGAGVGARGRGGGGARGGGAPGRKLTASGRCFCVFWRNLLP